MLGKCHIWRCWVKGSFWKGTPWSCINIGVKLTGRERRCEPCFMCKALYPDLWEPKVLAFPPWTHSCWWAVNQTGQPLSNKIHNLFYEEILGCSCFSKENIWKCFYSSIFFFLLLFFLSSQTNYSLVEYSAFFLFKINAIPPHPWCPLG